MSSYPALDQADVKGKRVLLRAGFDVGIENGKVTDTERIEALLPTMEYILKDAALIIMSHEGRPKGKRNMEFSQEPIVPILEKLLNRKVQFADSCVGPETEQMAKNLKPGEVLFLENLRFEAGEEGNDPDFAKQLAALADIYVNDAFTNCHRAHASMVGVPKLLPSYLGLQLAKEVQYLSPLVEGTSHPLTLIISGAKMETKVPIIEHFLRKGDDLLLGGCIANTFVAASGFNVGLSKYEQEYVDQAKKFLEASDTADTATIHFPESVVVAESPESKTGIDVSAAMIGPDVAIFDIGKTATAKYCDIIKKSAMIVWNGPLGLYESEPFSHGSVEVAKAIAAATAKGAKSIIGGGDTIDFHTRYGLPLDAYTFVSTGGGAMLEFIGGKKLPALEALKK